MDWRQLLSHVILAGRGNVEAAESKGIDTGRNAPPLCGDKVMIEKNVQPGQPSSQSSTTQQVVDLLTSILNEVRQEVRRATPPPLTQEAQEAVDQFKEINAALLLLHQFPTVSLKADRTTLPAGESTNLTWKSTNAHAVSIDPIGVKVTPVASGVISVPVSTTTKFIATAKGLSGSAKSNEVVVNVSMS